MLRGRALLPMQVSPHSSLPRKPPVLCPLQPPRLTASQQATLSLHRALCVPTAQAASPLLQVARCKSIRGCVLATGITVSQLALWAELV